MTRIKICGLTNATDCAHAAAAGAHLLGFNFWPGSKRFVKAEQAAALMEKLPSQVTKVGLFVNAEPSYIRDILAHCPLDLLQFHGDESADFCRAFNVPFMKAFRLSDETVVAQIPDYLDHSEHPFLVDAYVPGRMGGTGNTISLQLAQMAAQHGQCMMLAGGLAPHNVAAAMAAINPWAVDVASGVESAPGQKSQEQMIAFVDEVRRQDSLQIASGA